jgi:type II secretory pathway component PulF
MKPDDLIALNDELAAMARAGLPLDQGLAALAKEMGHGRLQQVTAGLAADLRAGRTLPEALDRQGKRVPPFYAGLVEAGVRSGRVAEVLATLTEYARSLANLRALVIDAALYPIVVLVLSCSILGVVIGYLVPQYGTLFREFGLQLPAVTQFVLTISQQPATYLLVPLLVVVGIYVLAYAFLGGTARWRCASARMLYATPIIGTLVRSARMAAFTDLLAILVDYGLPLPRAFRLATEASSDPLLSIAGLKAQKDLEAGQPLGPALRQRLHVPELIAWMSAVGEQRGELGKTLHHVAELYRHQAERRAALLRTVLPPFLIVITAGILVCLFVFALMLPLVKLLEGLSQ